MDGWPLKAFMTLSSMNSTGSEFVSSVLMLEHWMMVRFRDGLLTELPMELSPTGALQRCVVFPIGNVNEACYCFFLLVNVFSVIVKAYDLKLFVDAMIPFFVSQVSDREQSVIWNETTLPIMLQRECIC